MLRIRPRGGVVPPYPGLWTYGPSGLLVSNIKASIRGIRESNPCQSSYNSNIEAPIRVIRAIVINFVELCFAIIRIIRTTLPIQNSAFLIPPSQRPSVDNPLRSLRKSLRSLRGTFPIQNLKFSIINSPILLFSQSPSSPASAPHPPYIYHFSNTIVVW
ncbi:hypothetical protein CLV93_1053 [Prolixibacter denitrificans]|uniref:Uncharacterized protein n=1 Tax=Prolixibacter denitrificans TaxID=1541063 RepID=A0A2P8CCF9_9BACT|nr:hypothetical protein CLV93_1053 [Prolixibacter denitrificans]